MEINRSEYENNYDKIFGKRTKLRAIETNVNHGEYYGKTYDLMWHDELDNISTDHSSTDTGDSAKGSI